ncbi:hypothetical protein MUP59_11280 [Candidatus Bathyarchaeota archaeon]|nr:hypothetical protein [Candidatus Bathyarchaeota archaeon]
MLEGEGKFINRPTQTGGKLYDKYFIYVPTEVARDGLFPFKTSEPVKVRINVENRQLVIEKLK